MKLVARVHDVTAEDLEVALAIADRHRGLSTADAVHAAVARRHGIGVILSADTDFDNVSGIRRVDPLDAAAVTELMHD
jgi:predicted nucleic acid-binding protein